LIIDPAIPSLWKSYTAERVYRGTRYLIEVDNSGGFQKGVKEIQINGISITGNILPVSNESICKVKVIMG
jgi:cellobiose phosphorylase